MAMTKQQIIDEAMKLDPAERDEVAQEIWQRNCPPLTAEQRAELRRRIEAVDRGEVEMLDGEQVMRELRERYARK